MSWDDLSMREKAAMMRVAVKNKIFEIDKIKEAYNNLDRLVSNSEVINPNLYTPSVNLNVNPALDYVGNALESISGYEYEGNPLNKLGIDMSFDLGTTGSSMYPNGVRFVKKFAEGGSKYVPEKIKLESRPYIPSVKNVTDFTGNPVDNPTDLYYYDGKPLYLSTLNNMFGEDNYRVLKYDNGDVFIEPKFVETEMTIPELLVEAKMSELAKQQLDELEEKQLLLYWESPALIQGGEFKLNQPSTMNYISTQVGKDTGTNFADRYFTGAGYSPTFYKNMRALDDRYDALSLGLLSPSLLFAAPELLPAIAPGTTAGNIIGNAAGSLALGMALEESERAIFGKSAGDIIVGGLNDLGVNPFISELGRVEYFLNPTGLFTGKLLNRIGMGLDDPLKAYTHVGVGNSIERSAIHGRTYTPIDEAKHFYQNKIAPAIDSNLDKLQVAVRPWLHNGQKKANVEVPEVKLVEKGTPVEEGTILLPKFKSNKNNEILYGDLLTLKSPNIKGQGYKNWNSDNSLSIAINGVDNILAGAAAADVALSEDRDPFIRALEYGILARRGLLGIINNRLRNHDKLIQDYYSKLNSGLQRANYKLNKYDALDTKMVSKSIIDNSKSYKKPGVNLEKASYLDLVNFIKKGNYDKYSTGVKLIDDGIFDSEGRLLARKGENGNIDIVDTTELSNLLLKNIDIVDYQTGKSYKGSIHVDENKNVVIPQEYLDILNNNVEYIKNLVFPNSGIKLYGSSSGVTGAGFPHATHDIDFYITQDLMDLLLKSGKVKDTERISPGTYRHLLHNNLYGEKGWIDLNVLEKDASGNAVGIRAEELYKLYFPEEYFKALREALALAEQTGTKALIKINRTPEELLEVMDPDTKSIMDSFDIDYLGANKAKHRNRAWMHLVYSDPEKVSLGLLQYAKSMLGDNMQGLQISLDALLDLDTNIQALKKIGVNLGKEEMEKIAKDPQRMKNVLNAWYIMDRTPMRAIKGTWPGVQGVTADNYINSATKWIADSNNGGNAHGAGLNLTIKGDSGHFGSLKAYISPEQNYNSTLVLDLIDEINYKAGLDMESLALLSNISMRDPMQAKALLEGVYNNTGKNFLSDGQVYGFDDRSIYVSGTRDFVPGKDNIGYANMQTHMRPLIQRLARNPNHNELKTLQKERWVTEGFQNIPHKYSPNEVSTTMKKTRIPKELFTEAELYFNYLTTGLGIGAGSLLIAEDEGLLSYDPENLILEINEDPVIASMSELDKNKFSSLYVYLRRSELRKTIKSERRIDRIIEDELMLLYNDYEEKYGAITEQ